ncbi:MAG: hypothetical protein CMB97_01395 [Flavobacteriaceae bacterium]|nr:hypothetical protein [Flavobacteriaceae bacterium]
MQGHCFRCSIACNVKFPDELKEANVSSIYKADDKTSKLNFRPISVLPSASQIYEKVLKAQIFAYFEGKLQEILCGSKESYSTQHALMRVIKKWKKCLDNFIMVGTVLIDLSKAYDCLPHDLLKVKLGPYGFELNSLKLI